MSSLFEKSLQSQRISSVQPLVNALIYQLPISPRLIESDDLKSAVVLMHKALFKSHLAGKTCLRTIVYVTLIGENISERITGQENHENSFHLKSFLS